jgi:hypothetical protein
MGKPELDMTDRIPAVELFAVDFPNYVFRVVRIGRDGSRRAIWSTDLSDATRYLSMLGQAKVHILEPGTWKLALEQEAIS